MSYGPESDKQIKNKKISNLQFQSSWIHASAGMTKGVENRVEKVPTGVQKSGMTILRYRNKILNSSRPICPNYVFLVALFLLHLFSSLSAQNENIKFDQIAIEQGLSQNSVFSIIQDRKGFLWFGTEDGFNMYDGYQFKVHKMDLKDPNSLSGNWVIAAYEDSKGVLWIGTESAGLNKFDQSKGIFTRYMKIPNDKNSLSDNRITSICADAAGHLWVGTKGGGVNKYDPEKNTFIHFKNDEENPNSLSHNIVNAVIYDPSGHLWFGTADGLNKYDPAAGVFTRYFSDPKIPGSLSANNIRTLYLDQRGDLWIGTDGGGLNRLDKENGIFHHYKNRPNDPASISGDVVNVIYEDNSGNFWVGTDGNGLNSYDKTNNVFTAYQHNISDPSSLVNNRVYSISEDRSGVLWIGTRGGGLSKLDLQKKKFIHHHRQPGQSNTLSNNIIWTFYEDNSGALWIGSLGGLDRFDRKTNRWTNYRHRPDNPNSLSHNYVRSIREDKLGDLWIGTDGGGVNRFNLKSGQFTSYAHNPDDPSSLSHNTIRPILVDRSGTIWIGTLGGGLNEYDRKTNRFKRYLHDPGDPNSLSYNYIYSLFEDRSGRLWIGTDGGGLNYFDREKNVFVAYKHDPEDPTSISNNHIYSVHEDAEGILWMGTRGGGLNRFDREKQQFSHYTVKDGLPNATIYAVLADDDGNLWLSTNNGLSKFNLQQETFKNYDISDGLQNNEFNGGAYYKGKDGKLYFGGIEGFNEFLPAEIQDNPIVPPVVITDFKIANKSVPIGGKIEERLILSKSITETEVITLSHKDEVFSFEFAALNYVSPEKNQYAYMLEGMDENWIELGTRRFVPYNRLPPGEYVFRVKASNSDGVWNEEGTSIFLNVTPPFWQTWWFRIILIVFVLLSVYIIYRIRVRSIEERSRELEENVKKRTKQATLLYEAGQRLSSELELDSLLSEIVNTVCDNFNYYGVMLFLPDKSGKELTLRSIAGGHRHIFPDGLTLKVGEGMIGKVASTKKFQICEDVSKDPDYIRQADEVTQSELSVPILSGDKLIGVLDIQSDKLNTFEKSDIAAVETLSTQIATAIDNARLYDRAQKEIADRKKAEKELLIAKRETDDILQNVKDGLFLLDREFIIESQYSAALEDILSTKTLVKISFIDFLKDKIDKETLESLDNYLTILYDKEIDEETLSDLNPLSPIEINFETNDPNKYVSKFLDFDFRRISENGKTLRIIATVNDITEKIHLEMDLEESREENKRKMDLLLSILNVEPVMLKEFLKSTQDEIDQVNGQLQGIEQKDRIGQKLEDVYRSIHTIKGNASLLELNIFAEKAHQVEDKIAELKEKKQIQFRDIRDLLSEIEMVQSIHSEMKGLIDQIGKIHDQFRPKQSHEHNMLVKSLNKLVQNLGDEYDKKINLITSDYKNEIVPFKQRLVIRDVLVQLIRNSVYHGIETLEERRKLGKSDEGNISIRNFETEGKFTIQFRDDGRGLPLEQLRQKAKESGKWQPADIDQWDDKKIAETIFQIGISTSEKADMAAGRGVGMDIIRKKVESQGGTINIDFREDRYCEFNIEIPKAS